MDHQGQLLYDLVPEQTARVKTMIDLKNLRLRKTLTKILSYLVTFIFGVPSGILLYCGVADGFSIVPIVSVVIIMVGLVALQLMIIDPYLRHLEMTEDAAINRFNQDRIMVVTENYCAGRKNDIVNHMTPDDQVHDGTIVKVQPLGNQLKIVEYVYCVLSGRIQIDNRLCVAKNPVEFFKIQNSSRTKLGKIMPA